VTDRPQAAFDIELLRFKQFRGDPGRVVRSEGSPRRPRPQGNLLHQRPAQPLAATRREAHD